MRYCVGVAPFADDAFAKLPEQPDLWRASFVVADAQTLLCTDWFDVAKG